MVQCTLLYMYVALAWHELIFSMNVPKSCVNIYNYMFNQHIEVLIAFDLISIVI